MKKIILIAAAITLFSCNAEYQRQLEQGAKAWCEAKEVDKQLESDPQNYDLIEQRARLLRAIDDNKELSGDPEKFDKDMKELSKDC